MNVIIRKCKTLLKLTRLLLVDYLASRHYFTRQHRTLLVVKLDAIGDYILFRNFLAFIRRSDLFKNYRITLCGNEVWKDFAEKSDNADIDEFIWISRKRFLNDLAYRSKILNMINGKGFEVALQSSYSREFFYCDAIVKASRATRRIGQSGDARNITKRAKYFSDRFYTKLITLAGNETFEFYRNRDFFENVLESRIDVVTPTLDISGIGTAQATDAPYAVIFPGAAEEFRRWPAARFAEIADFLAKTYGLQILIAGSEDDAGLALKIRDAAGIARIRDLTGRTPLPELAKLIAMSELLVSNDTSAVHIAVAVGARVICISNGNHFGRFHPYPRNMAGRASFVYPPDIMEQLGDPMKLYSRYGGGSSVNIESIPVTSVTQEIDSLLSR